MGVPQTPQKRAPGPPTALAGDLTEGELELPSARLEPPGPLAPLHPVVVPTPRALDRTRPVAAGGPQLLPLEAVEEGPEQLLLQLLELLQQRVDREAVGTHIHYEVEFDLRRTHGVPPFWFVA